jgi:hypothetical protein
MPPSQVEPFPFLKQTSRASLFELREPGTVVAGEEDERILGELFIAQGLQDGADRLVELFDDVAIKTARAPARKLLGGKQRHMRHRVRQVQKEWLLLVFANEASSLVGIAAGDCVLIDGPLDHVGIAQERHIPELALRREERRPARRRIGDAVHIVRVGNPKVRVKAVLRRQELRQVAQMPFADAGRRIALGFQSSAIVASSAGNPPRLFGNSTRRRLLHIPLRGGRRPVSNAARLGVQTSAAE